MWQTRNKKWLNGKNIRKYNFWRWTRNKIEKNIYLKSFTNNSYRYKKFSKKNSFISFSLVMHKNEKIGNRMGYIRTIICGNIIRICNDIKIIIRWISICFFNILFNNRFCVYYIVFKVIRYKMLIFLNF